jgi:YidC/Oxa1 family membrane protein insertase
MMDGQQTRIILVVALFCLGFALFTQWEQEQIQKAPPAPIRSTVQSDPSLSANSEIPAGYASATPQPVEPALQSASFNEIPQQRLVEVNSDVLNFAIDLHGGSIVSAQLKQYPQQLDTPEQGYQLLDHSPERFFIASSGLMNEAGPDTKQFRAKFSSEQTSYTLNGQERLEIPLYWENGQGLKVKKVFTIYPNQYLIDVQYKVENTAKTPWSGKFYTELQRQNVATSGKHLPGMNSYTGAAVFTPDKPYKKLSFADMKKERFSQIINGGWAAMVEHYFLSAWVPTTESKSEYYTRTLTEDRYAIGMLKTVEVPAGQQQQVGASLYMGPEVAETLKAISPGLELTIDYGILWPISQMLFFVLKKINHFIGNWGWSIISITLLIKLVFYKLSAASYRSMAQLRRLQPKIEALKQRLGDDKQQFSQSLMELYRKERINPLGGCLPILVQIPVFIALYYVLLESVELRQAPFMLWVKDLSSKDPYYILPLIMGLTMFIQQKLNPTPADPIQAKVLMFMPVVFTVLFISFPAGLVLYWVTNNVLSILQQWAITRNLEQAAAQPTVIKKNK